MEVVKILEKAKALGVFLSLKEDTLVLKSTQKKIDPDFLAILKKEKQNIIDHLRKYQKRDRSAIISLEEKIKVYDRSQYEHIPLSFSQERLWFMDQLQGSLEYHIPFVFRLSGDLDQKVLFRSLQQVVQRHEVLRTVIYSEEGIGYQKLLPADDWELSSKDLSDDLGLVRDDLKVFLSRPFDLGTDYMFRACLYRVGQSEYVLAGVFHHISSDGWSQGILVREFMSIYHAFVNGKEAILPPLPLQYIDYALWQRSYLEGDIIDKLLSYWEQQLEGVPALQLPTDYPRPSIQSVAGDTLSFELNDTLSTKINALSKREGVTVFMTLLAAFKVLLSRYSGQEDICVGTPIANRTQKELEGLIGFFVNTLALRSEVKSGSSFQEFLQAVKQTTLGAYDHQQIPFENVVERVVKTRDMSMSPLFQALFVLQNTPDSGNIEMDGLTLSNYEERGQVTSKFDMTVTVNESDRNFSLSINYCTDLFREATIQRLFDHYQVLLTAVVASPSSQLGDLSLLQEEEKNQLLHVFNDTTVSYPDDQTVVELFETQVSKTPEATALVFEGASLTYQELDERSNQLARYLTSQGVGPDVLVGICIHRSLEMLVGILGILKAGGAYVPIDPEFPQARIDYMLEDSGVKLVLSATDCNAVFSDTDELNVTLLDSEWSQKIGKRSVKPLKRVATAQNLAYVIYTSGSTGQPKGVLNAHQGIVNQLLWTRDTYDLTSEDVVVQKTTFSFDVSAWEILWPLISGARLVLARPKGQADVAYLKELIASEQVTIIHFVPSMLGAFLEGVSAGECSSLQRILCSGEALTPEHLRSLRELFPTVHFDNLYGPTEAAVHVSSWSVPEDVNSLTCVPIGSPVANTSLFVLDAEGGLVPVGVIGELCIGGAQLAQGYHRQEALTNEHFVAHPFQSGERIYKTGDLARWLPDGTIEYIGRKDTQVKVRGYRIELGEIENTLSLLSGVVQCSVLAREDGAGMATLIAYVVMDDELKNATWKELLQAQLRQSLPEYMVPQLWVQLEEMPLTANGKLDRKALPSPDCSALSSKEFVAPRTETETQLAEIWEEFLGVEKVGVYDNFFELGGHSLLAVRLIARLQKIGYGVTIRDIFANPSIASLSPQLSSAADAYQVPANGIEERCPYITPDMVPLVDLDQEELEKIMDAFGGGANIQDIYPLSPLQEGIYFHHLMSDRTKGDPYVLSSLLSFSSETSRSAFIEALQFVVDRHDVLRTAILSTGLSREVQVVLRQVALPIEELPIDDTQEILPQVQQAVAPGNLWIDSSKAPMLQLKTADDPANETYYLALNHHHLMMDHLGLEKVQKEVALFLSGKADLLPAPSLYRDFIGDTLREEKLAESRNYFQELYGGVTAPTYPFNLSDNQVDGSTRIVTADAMLAKDLRDDLRRASGKLQISPAVLFHAAFGLVVGRCSNEEYALFGSVLLGRLQGAKGSESSLGLFMNTLPVLLELKGDVNSYIQHTNERLQGLLPHEQTPLSKIHQWSGVANDAPLFSALLNYRHSARSTSSDESIDLGVGFLSGEERTNYPFSIDVDDYGDDFGLKVKLSDQEIDPSDVLSYMQEALGVLIKEINEGSPAGRLEKLSIVPQEEKHQLLDVFNDTDVDYPTNQTVVDLIEAQAAKTPEVTAVVYEGDSLSYQELNARSNQLARYLNSQGVGPDVLVGICISRSLEMMVGILGILKAGGAYVPVDPEYPQARIDYMLHDSEAKVILSSGEHAATFEGENDLNIVLLDKEWSQKIGKRSAKNLKRVAGPEHLAYVIYTSGSTGQPKGVMNAHRGILNQLLWTRDTHQLTAEDVVIQKTTFSFDVSVWEILWPLISGAKLVLARSQGQADISYLKELMSREQVTTIHFVPSMFAVFLEDVSHGDCSTLQRVLCSGEALTPEHLRSFRKLFPHVSLDNLYGPTEAAVHVSSWSVPKDVRSLTSVPIGSPVANTKLYVLDANENMVPAGVIGELCIGGEQVAIGYLNKESLTREKFIDNPYKAGDRLYKTGDLARWMSDGTIEYVGRKDTQVKVRGFRIELGEIENALSVLPGINQCCVLAKADAVGSNTLVAYVVTDDTELNREGLQTQLKQRLPEYMVPQLWVQLDEMPLTANGKLDRKALPSLDPSTFSSKAYVAPRNEVETQLAQIWQDLLGIEQVGIYDNFFELGGHSLLVVRLISRIQEIGYSINIREIFSHPSIDELSTKLSTAKDGYEVPANGIATGCSYITPEMLPLIELSQEELEKVMDQVVGGGSNVQDIYPLSPLQRGIYFHHLMSDPAKGDPYVLSSLLSFSSAEKRSEFIAALKFVVDRHDVLRTCILNDGLSQPIQVVLRAAELSVTELAIDRNIDILPQVQQAVAPENLWIDPSQAPMLAVKVADDVANETYYLAINHHHLMMDHLGLEKVQREVALYLAGQAELLPTPSLYRDFIGDTLREEKLADSEAYFNRVYGNISEPTYPFNLTDNQVDGSTRIMSSKALVSPELRDSLRKASGRLQISPAVLFHAAFGLVVGRCSDADYALFGSVLLGRLQGSKGAESSLGLFMNTLPVLLELKGDVAGYIEHTNASLQELLSHEQTPLSKIHQWSGISNEVPLFSALLNYRHTEKVVASEKRDDVIDLGVEFLSGEERTNFPFSVDVDDYGDDFGLHVKLTDPALDPAAVIAYMEESLKLLLESADQNTQSTAIEALNIVSAKEKQQLLAAFNDTTAEYPSNQTLVDYFEQQAAKTPEATAIAYEADSLTYQELNERANQLARYLASQGVGPDVLVGICINRSLEMLVSILGVLKAGGAYVPIDPDYPQSRIDYMLEDAGVKVVLSSSDCGGLFADKAMLDLTLLDTEWKKKIGKRSAKNLKRVAGPGNLAYVIYTSGSTGKPKGVLNSHKGILNQLLWTRDTYGLTSEDVVLQKTTFSFDVSVWEILWPLISGAKLVFVRPGSQGDVNYLKELIVKEQATTIHFVPSMLAAFLAGTHRGECDSLRRVLCSGEALTVEQVKSFRVVFPDVRLDNLYGPTEASVHVTCWSAPEEVSSLARVLIGGPVANTSLYVLDSNQQLVPVGAVGELCIGGDQVAVGYLNQQSLTEDRFVSDPYQARGRLYKTGDLARWLPDGNIEYLGRKDSQVKVRGYRIELGEIENAIASLPEVQQAAVLSKKDVSGAHNLIAYMTVGGHQDMEFYKEVSKASLREVLPEYMVPQLWVVLDEMPLTASGKLDRKALPALENFGISAREYVAPQTEVELQLATRWQALLGVEKIGVHDNFFELGGHSLLAVQLISAIQELGYQVSVRDIFDYPSIALLSPQLLPVVGAHQVPDNGIFEGCAYITPEMVPLATISQDELEQVMDYVPKGAANIQDIYPLSPLQKGFYFHHVMGDQSKGDPYVLSTSLSFSAVDQREKFMEALQFVIARHDVLRTCVVSEGLSEAMQIVLREVELPVSELPINDNEDIITQVNNAVAPENLWIDVSQAPMFNLLVADDVVNGNYYLILKFHHLMMDHIGLEKVQQEVAMYLSGKGDLLPTPVLYRNFIGEVLRKEKSDESKKYFSALYSDISEPTYPFSITDNQVDGSTQIVSEKVMLPAELRDAVRAVSSDLQMSPAVLFYAAFGLVVGRSSNADHALFGSILLGRLQGAKGSASSLGLFMNTLPVLLDLKGDVSEYITETNERLQKLMDYEQTPLSDVQDWSEISNEVPMFSTLLNYRHTATASLTDEKTDLEAEYLGGGSRNNLPFNFDVDDYGHEFGLTAKISDVGISPAAVISYMEEALTVLIKDLRSESPSLPVEELSVVPATEKRQLLEVFNETGISSNTKRETIIDLFESQVVKSPEATALVYQGESLSYQQLNERANQLARYLGSKGVKSDVLVGLCVERSLEMMIGLWGILKAGGAYVPIDPEFPHDRKEYMLADSGISVLLSDRKNSTQFAAREGLEVIELDSNWNQQFGKRSVKNLKRIAAADHLIYVIYTSGSTGKPKGVQITHQNMVDYFHGLVAKTNIESCTSFGLTSSIATDLGNTVLYASLLTGGALHVLTEDELISAEKMSLMDVDCLKMVPSHWKTLQTNEAVFVPNKCLILGGEAFTDDIFDLLADHQVSCEVYNHYGPTETTIGKLIHKVSLTEKPDHSIPLGTPFGNNSVYVLNNTHHLCPIGVVGELCIGGDGVAVGYLNRESLTAEKFVANPFKPEDRIYKTGDLARWLPNGTIEFFGRKDNQIKIRGYRIELGEIENVLASLEGIQNSCVLASEDDHGDKRLVGYVVMEGELEKPVLQEALLKRLPEYMVPTLWVKLDEMPLTSNGKIDRKSLPEPDSEGLSSREYVAPNTDTEKQLAEIWQDLLDVEQVGIYDNFFEMGGQSLLAIRLMARIQKLGFTINIQDFYESPDIASLSTKLTSIDTGYQVPKNGIMAGCTYITPSMVTLVDLSQEELDKIMDHVPGGGINIQDIYPLAPLQEGIYYHHLISDTEHGDPYVLPRLLPFPSPEKRSEFLEALNFVIERHDVLRTCVLNDGFSQAIQVVQRQVDLPVETLPIDPNRDVLSQVQKEIAPDSLYMDLTTAPTLRAKVADDEANGLYYLVLHNHHIMIDHIGMAKVVEEIICYLSGQAAVLPTPALYRDFIGDTLNKEKLEASKKYFTELYADVTESTYPFDLSDTKIDGGSTIVSSQTMLSAELKDRIRKVSGEIQVSPAVLFHAAFGLVVGRCSSKDYAIFGSVLLGRLQGSKGSDASLGLFMNTLPIMMDLKGDVPTYLHHTNDRLQELLNFEQTPLSKIHQWSNISNEVPLFSALLNYRHTTPRPSDQNVDSAAGNDMPVIKQRTNYPFNIEVDDYGDDFKVTAILSDTGIAPATVVSYMEEALTVLLQQIGQESASVQMAQLSILSDSERQQLLTVYDHTDVAYPKDQTIVDLFEKQVANAPEAIAAVYGDDQLSYQELDARANQLARYLITKGIKADDLVGICVDRSLEMMVGIIGILKSGGAYVPIDPEYPQSRIDYMLEDSGVEVLLTSSDCTNVFSEREGLDVVLLDSNWESIGKESGKPLKRISSPDNLAYVIYTSGSTGKPKGVLIEHINVVRLLQHDANLFDFSSQDVWTLFHSFCFDFSVWEIFGALLLGGRLVIVPKETAKDSVAFSHLLIEEGVTVLNQTPSAFYALKDEFLSKASSTAIRYVIFGGEALNPRYLASWKSSYPDCKLINMYGITETTVHVTYKEITEMDIHHTVSTIGTAIPTLSCYLLDDHMNLVPQGVVGEFCVGGSGVARGYLNREALNEERFVLNPFSEDDKSRLYKSGDLGRLLPDGSIEYIGRKDNQVKVRGYRIELGEIENALSLLPGVSQCCVIAREDTAGSNALVAYAVTDDELNKEVLQAQLLKSLPDYMVPQLWVGLDEMPLTANGKLDKKALPAVDSAVLSSKEYVEPRTDLERQLVAIWQELLGVEKVGVYDNFFELGGHSLLATRLVAAIVKELKMDIKIRDVFHFVNIDDLSTYLEHRKIKEQQSSDKVYKKTIKL